MQLAEFDNAISAKDEEIKWLKSRLISTSDKPVLLRTSPPGMPSEGEMEEAYPPMGEGEPLP